MTGIFARTGHNYQVLLVMYSCVIDPRICLTFFGLENRLTKPKPLWFQFPPTKRFLTCSSILTSNITLSLKLQKGNSVDFSGIHFLGVKTLKTFNQLQAVFLLNKINRLVTGFVSDVTKRLRSNAMFPSAGGCV